MVLTEWEHTMRSRLAGAYGMSWTLEVHVYRVFLDTRGRFDWEGWAI